VTLENQFSEVATTQPSLLAHHWAEAGRAKEAVSYWLKAGQQAVARSVMVEAAAQLRKGLEHLVTNLPENPDRDQQELEFQVALCPALFATKGFASSEVGTTVARARQLAEQLDRAECLVPLLYGQWVFHVSRSEPRLALSFGEQVERIAQDRDDSAALALSRVMQGIARFSLAEFHNVRVLLEQCAGLREPAHRAIYAKITAEDPYTVMLTYLAQTLACLGYVDQGRRMMIAALSEARRLNHACTLSLALGASCKMEWRIGGSPNTIKEHAEEEVVVATQHGFPHRLGEGYLLLGWSMTGLGMADQGLDYLTRGLQTIRSTGTIAGNAIGLIMIAEAHCKLGRGAERQKALAEAIHIIDATDERNAESEYYRLRGDLLNAIAEDTAAEHCYEEAIAVATRQGSKLFELRAASSLARLWRDQGKRTEAHDLLAPVYGWFTEGFDTPILKEAKALLDEFDGRPSVMSSLPA
jgi:predicted ATPase